MDHDHYATGALVPGIVRVSVLVALALAYLSPSALVARASAALAAPSVWAPVFGLVSALEAGLGWVALRQQQYRTR